jgi:hypothetical protein
MRRDLHRRCQAVYDALPPQLHYYAHDKIPKDCEGKHLTGRAYLMLNFLQNSFLIDRVAIARGLPNEQGLLDTAMEMMDVTITFWIKRDQVMHFSPSFDWIVSCCSISRHRSPLTGVNRSPTGFRVRG